jgi:hypothetical protein
VAPRCATRYPSFDQATGLLTACSPCDPGFKGNVCDTACGVGKYGAGCTQACAMPDNCGVSTCAPTDGSGEQCETCKLGFSLSVRAARGSCRHSQRIAS